MLEKLFQKAMGFLQKPEAAFNKEKKTELMEGFIYLAILSIITAVLSGIVSLSFGNTLVIPTIVSGYMFGIVGAVLGGLWLHLWAYIFGAKGKLEQTLKTMFYGGTPSYLLGWVPFVGILAGLWSIYLTWIGLQNLHGLKGDRAAFAVITAFIIPLLIFAALGIMLAMMFADTTQFTGLLPGF